MKPTPCIYFSQDQEELFVVKLAVCQCLHEAYICFINSTNESSCRQKCSVGGPLQSKICMF